MQEEALQGNENIKQAIAALQQKRHPGAAGPRADGHPPPHPGKRPVRGSSGAQPRHHPDELKSRADPPDGRAWWYAFTSFEEEMRGAEQVQSTFMADIGKLLETALTVPEIEGIILNPWHRTLMLDKTLIQIILPESPVVAEDAPMKILVSACLLGENCKYSGGNNYSEKSSGLCAGA